LRGIENVVSVTDGTPQANELGTRLVPVMVTIALGNGPLQLAVVGASMSEMLAEQVSPFGRQASRGETVDFDPLTIFPATFGHH
jgi:hypothetical protein